MSSILGVFDEGPSSKVRYTIFPFELGVGLEAGLPCAEPGLRAAAAAALEASSLCLFKAICLFKSAIFSLSAFFSLSNAELCSSKAWLNDSASLCF